MKYLIFLWLVLCSTVLQAIDSNSSVFYRSYYETMNIDKNALLSLPFYTGSRSLNHRVSIDMNVISERASLSLSFLGSSVDSLSGYKDSSLSWNEAYFSLDINDWATVYSGRRILKWGNGFFENPSSLMDSKHTLSDPDNTNKETTGNDISGLDFIFETRAVNLAVTESGLVGVRYYQYLENLDYSVIGYFKQKSSVKLGLNASYVIGDNTQIYGECLFYRPEIGESENLLRIDENDCSYKTDAVLGVFYTTKKKNEIICELFFNGSYYGSREFKRILNDIEVSRVSALEGQSPQQFSQLAGKVMAQKLRRVYLFTRYHSTITSRLSFYLISLCNLADFSGLVIPELTYTFENRFKLVLKAICKVGNSYGESGIIPMESSIQVGITKTF